jgi:Flp pilus assembly pilin Flp
VGPVWHVRGVSLQAEATKQNPTYNLELNMMMQSLVRHISPLRRDEGGQGLVEYLLILALVAFGAVAGMGSLATGLNSAFNEIGAILGLYIT